MVTTNITMPQFHLSKKPSTLTIDPELAIISAKLVYFPTISYKQLRRSVSLLCTIIEIIFLWNTSIYSTVSIWKDNNADMLYNNTNQSLLTYVWNQIQEAELPSSTVLHNYLQHNLFNFKHFKLHRSMSNMWLTGCILSRKACWEHFKF